MTVRYHTRRGVEIPDYQCVRACIETGGPRCQTVPGEGVDTAVSQLLIDTLSPLALDVALSVQAELESRADDADALRRHDVERARHRADLARRRYLAVDPDNRLVADSLEADWNDALRAARDAQDDYDKHAASAAAQLDEQHKDRIRALAADFPTLWTNPATDQRERKRMVRLLIEDVSSKPIGSTPTSASAAERRPASPCRSRPRRGSCAKPTLTRSPHWTGCSTSTPTPRPPQRSTRPVTDPAKANPSPPASCSTYAARTRFPAT
jgi:hypothetical protein